MSTERLNVQWDSIVGEYAYIVIRFETWHTILSHLKSALLSRTWMLSPYYTSIITLKCHSLFFPVACASVVIQERLMVLVCVCVNVSKTTKGIIPPRHKCGQSKPKIFITFVNYYYFLLVLYYWHRTLYCDICWHKTSVPNSFAVKSRNTAWTPPTAFDRLIFPWHGDHKNRIFNTTFTPPSLGKREKETALKIAQNDIRPGRE